MRMKLLALSILVLLAVALYYAAPHLRAYAGVKLAEGESESFVLKQTVVNQNAPRSQACGNSYTQETFMRGNGEKLVRTTTTNCTTGKPEFFYEGWTNQWMIMAHRLGDKLVKTSYRVKPGTVARRLSRMPSPIFDCARSWVDLHARGEKKPGQRLHGVDTVRFDMSGKDIENVEYRAPRLRCASLQWSIKRADDLAQKATPARLVIGPAAEPRINEAFAELAKAEEMSPLQATAKMRGVTVESLAGNKQLAVIERRYRLSRAD